MAGIVEVDETHIGGRRRGKTIRAAVHKREKKTYRSVTEFGARSRPSERRKGFIRTPTRKSSFLFCSETATCDLSMCSVSPLRI
jgi:hypothetical protein